MNVFHKEICTEINQDTILRNVSRVKNLRFKIACRFPLDKYQSFQHASIHVIKNKHQALYDMNSTAW